MRDEQHGAAEAVERGREREPAEQRLEERGLAAPVGPDDGEPIPPADLQINRAEPKAPKFDDCALEAGNDLAASPFRPEVEPELPRLERLRDLLQSLDPVLETLLDVAGLLLPPLARLARADDPVAPLAQLLLELRLLGLVGRERVVVAAQRPRAGGLVLAPTARILDRPVGALVELDDPRHRPVEEGAIVRDDDRRPADLAKEALEQVESVEF